MTTKGSQDVVVRGPDTSSSGSSLTDTSIYCQWYSCIKLELLSKQKSILT